MKDPVKRAIFVVMAVALGLGAVAAQPQSDCETTYAVFLENRKGPEIEKLKIAMTRGKEYLAKCSSLEGQEAVRDYVTKQLPKIEETVRIKELEIRFDAAVQAKNWAGTLSSGKELMAANHPMSLDIMIVAASIGYTSAASNPPIDTYNDVAITYARQVIERLNEGKTSNQYGAYQFAYKTTACPDGRTNTISWMNYTIGYIKYKRQKQTKEAIPYLVMAQNAGCELKDYPEIYRLIGAWYLDGALELDRARDEKIKAAGDQETIETRANLALIKGYTDRAIDAYARAFKTASTRPEMPQAYKDALYKRLQDLFDSRFAGNHNGVDQFVAGVMSKPFVDPAAPVSPVAETPSNQNAPATVPIPKRP